MVDTTLQVYVVQNRGNSEVPIDDQYFWCLSNRLEFHLLSLNSDTTGNDSIVTNPEYVTIRWNGE
jgi:hypothetical protein